MSVSMEQPFSILATQPLSMLIASSGTRALWIGTSGPNWL